MKTPKNFLKLLVVLTLFYSQVFGIKNFICSIESRNGRLLDFRYLNSQGKYLFYLVSYAVFSSSSDMQQSFFQKYIFDKESIRKFLTIGMRMGYQFEYTYGDGIYKFDLKRMELPSNFNQNVSCNRKLITFYRTVDVVFREEGSYEPNLLFGCKVHKIKENYSVEKSIILVANNANGSSYTEQQVADLAAENPKIINLNYSMFATRGYRICDDIVDFLKCEEPNDKPNSYHTF